MLKASSAEAFSRKIRTLAVFCELIAAGFVSLGASSADLLPATEAIGSFQQSRSNFGWGQSPINRPITKKSLNAARHSLSVQNGLGWLNLARWEALGNLAA